MATMVTLCRQYSFKLLRLNRVYSSSTCLQLFRNKSWDKNLRDDLWLKEEGSKTFAEIKEELEFKDPKIYESVDISLPEKKGKTTFGKKSQNLKLLHQLRKDSTLEQAARLRKLEVPLDEVKKDWYEESWAGHTKTIAEHYGIYQDLFRQGFFYPRVQMNVSYDYDEEFVTPVHHGNEVLPSEAGLVPNVTYDASDDTLWTLCLTCPDEHLQEEDKEYLHWFIGNIPGNDVSKGELLCNYLPPFPPKGTGRHRYVFILYKQDKLVDYGQEKRPESCISLKERTFSTYEFYKAHEDYITPAGLAFFQSEYDESVRNTFYDVLNMKEPTFEYDYPPDYHPQQVRFPHKKPFNLYLERYRDKKEIAEEVLKERLKMISPFEDYPKQPRYPDVFRIDNDVPQWYKLVEHQRRKRLGKFKDLP